MKKIISVFITGIFVFIFFAYASAEISLKAEVDKKQLNTDETVTYKLALTSSEKNIPQPQMPKFGGFRILSQAQSSTVTFNNSKLKSILIFAYILAPEAAGKYKIEPAQIKAKNVQYQSEAFEIEVTPGEKPLLPPEEPGKEQPKTTL